jgi:hypothetical protein
MTFRVVRAQRAQTELARFAEYAADYSDDWAREQFARLERVFSRELAEAPQQWSYFYLTGAPYRAYLFRVGRRTQFWIVYTIDEDTNTVNILRFWNARGNSETFAI